MSAYRYPVETTACSQPSLTSLVWSSVRMSVPLSMLALIFLVKLYRFLSLAREPALHASIHGAQAPCMVASSRLISQCCMTSLRSFGGFFFTYDYP